MIKYIDIKWGLEGYTLTLKGQKEIENMDIYCPAKKGNAYGVVHFEDQHPKFYSTKEIRRIFYDPDHGHITPKELFNNYFGQYELKTIEE